MMADLSEEKRLRAGSRAGMMLAAVALLGLPGMLVGCGGNDRSVPSSEVTLHVAAGAGDSETVRRLLDAGADVHASEDVALRLAAANGHTETVALLLDRGADLNARNGEPLCFAEAGGHTETVALLKARGAGGQTAAQRP